MKDSEIAYEKIKNKIITTELQPGESISEAKLMEELQMGRTPVREALNRLSFEEQVRIIPRKCILVTEQPKRDLDAIFQMRYTLSELEGRLCASRHKESDVKKLRQIAEQLETEQDAASRVMLDREFHRCISAATGNSYLEKEMNILSDLSVRMIFLNENELDDVDSQVPGGHFRIIESIEAGDEEQTITLLRQHVVDFRNKFM